MPSTVNEHWLADFRGRMRRFEDRNGQGISLSVKIRVDSGCYCRSCCPAAHRQLDEYLAKHLDRRWQEYVEHESGPEFLIYLGAATVGLGFAKAIIELVTAVIKARTEGRKQGDKRTEPMSVIVRGIGREDQYFEREILKVETVNPPKLAQVRDELTEAIELIAAEQVGYAASQAKPAKTKRQRKKPRKKKE